MVEEQVMDRFRVDRARHITSPIVQCCMHMRYALRRAQKSRVSLWIEYIYSSRSRPCHAHAVDCHRHNRHILFEIRQKQR